MTEINEETAWGTLKAGIIRFYGEGMINWSRENFEKSLHNDRRLIDSSFIKDKLEDLQKNGNIEIVGSEDVFFRVINI